MKLFLYGTLTEPTGFGRCAGTPVRHAPVPAILHGYERVALRGTRYPTLRRAPRAAVHGVIMRVNANMMMRLQNYESSRYRQIPVQLRTPYGRQRALCFMGDAPTKIAWRTDNWQKLMALRSRSF